MIIVNLEVIPIWVLSCRGISVNNVAQARGGATRQSDHGDSRTIIFRLVEISHWIAIRVVENQFVT